MEASREAGLASPTCAGFAQASAILCVTAGGITRRAIHEGSKLVGLRKLDAGVLDDIFRADRRPVRGEVGAPMAGLIHLEIGAQMGGPLDGGLPRLDVGSASATLVSRPEWRSLVFRPADSRSCLRNPFHRRLSRIRHLLHDSDCYWLERPCQAGLTR